MTYLYEALDKPTRLYIKQCPHCGLKYFGKTVNENIAKYPGSGVEWKKHLKDNNVLPTHLWHSDWYYDISIIRFATKFSNINNIVESRIWANLQVEDGLGSGAKRSSKTKRKISDTVRKTKNSLKWKETIGKEHGRKISEIKNNSVWKETVGKETSRKISKTKMDAEWKSTTGKDANIKRKQTRDSLEWKKTIGAEGYKKASEKSSITRNSEEWKRKNNKTCKCCGWYGDPANYARYHGEKCKTMNNKEKVNNDFYI